MPVTDSPSLRRALQAVNDEVNRFQYVTDAVLHHTEDFWTARMESWGRGDCDDYALTKRKLLLDLGYDFQSLWPTICKVKGDGHLVLIVHTDQDDLVLDNINPHVGSVASFHYDWLARLNPENKSWVALS